MKFGAMIAAKMGDWKLICELEQLGFDAVWVADSHMIWSDCYSVLALAAQNTTHIKLGTGVTNAATRIAPVTAHAIATINQIAPGRTFLGMGTGFSSMCLMGQEPVKVGPFRDYLRVVRTLLRGEEVEYELNGKRRTIRFLDTELGFTNTKSPIPIYVAANGPLALKAAGAYADGCIAVNDSITARDEALFAQRRTFLEAGAASVGRELPTDFQTVSGSHSCVLRPGETLASERVVDQIGATVTANTLHAWWELSQRTASRDFIPGELADVWENYLAYVERMDIAPDKRYLRVHRGHATYLPPEEREFVTPALIRAAGGLVGESDELIERIRVRERAGLKQITIMPAVDRARESFREFSEHVISRY